MANGNRYTNQNESLYIKPRAQRQKLNYLEFISKLMLVEHRSLSVEELETYHLNAEQKEYLIKFKKQLRHKIKRRNKAINGMFLFKCKIHGEFNDLMRATLHHFSGMDDYYISLHEYHVKLKWEKRKHERLVNNLISVTEKQEHISKPRRM